jgi:methylmalonyl-CoA/ethylmalonyl-CoA epimerase
MVLDHIGIVVRSLEDGIEQWTTLFGYRKNSDIVINTRQKVRIVFLSKKNSLPVKLVQPVAEDSPVYRFAGKGGGLHHLCFHCDSLDEAVAQLKQKGARFVTPPEPAEGFNNHRIAFFLTQNNLNVELIDTTEKAGWIPEA